MRHTAHAITTRHTTHTTRHTPHGTRHKETEYGSSLRQQGGRWQMAKEAGKQHAPTGGEGQARRARASCSCTSTSLTCVWRARFLSNCTDSSCFNNPTCFNKPSIVPALTASSRTCRSSCPPCAPPSSPCPIHDGDSCVCVGGCRRGGATGKYPQGEPPEPHAAPLMLLHTHKAVAEHTDEAVSQHTHKAMVQHTHKAMVQHTHEAPPHAAVC